MSSSSEQSTNSGAVESTKQQIRALVNEIAQLSKSDLGPEQYYAEFLQRIVSALAAVGGAVWTVGDDGQLQLAYQIKISETLLDPESDDGPRHFRLIADVARSAEPKLVPPQSGLTDENAAGNPTNYLLVLAPLRSDDQIEGVLEIFQRPDVQPASQRGYLQFVLQMCDFAGDWLKSHKLRQFTDRQSLWAQADRYSRLVHDSLDVREVAYAIANEGRQLIGCDRVSVAIKRGGKCRVEAISGQDTMDNRSNVVAMLGRLATRVVAVEDPLWYSGSTEDLPPQVEEALEEYVEESHSKSIVILPLRRPIKEDKGGELDDDSIADRDSAKGEIIGALIVEQIETELPRATLGPRIDLVFEHGSRSLSNCLDYNNLFLMPVWRAIGKATWVLRARTLPKTIAISLAVVAAALVLAFMPKSFDMEGDGVLQPMVKSDVFVDVDGIVTNVLVEHDQSVKKGDVLVKLRNTDLEVRIVDVDGKLRAVRQQLLSVRRNLIDSKGTLTPVEQVRLSGEALELNERKLSLERQYTLLMDQKKHLQVVSPIDGQVVTWQPKETLMHRPVSKGQVLLTVADPNSDWELEVFMKENRIGHVAEARDTIKQDLEVTYILATDPDSYRTGKIRLVDPSTYLHDEHGHSVRIKVDLDEDIPKNLRRPGAEVTADIHCGSRSLGYVWFHEAWEWFRREVWF